MFLADHTARNVGIDQVNDTEIWVLGHGPHPETGIEITEKYLKTYLNQAGELQTYNTKIFR